MLSVANRRGGTAEGEVAVAWRFDDFQCLRRREKKKKKNNAEYNNNRLMMVCTYIVFIDESILVLEFPLGGVSNCPNVSVGCRVL